MRLCFGFAKPNGVDKIAVKTILRTTAALLPDDRWQPALGARRRTVIGLASYDDRATVIGPYQEGGLPCRELGETASRRGARRLSTLGGLMPKASGPARHGRQKDAP